jgi:putative heme-binding domain-containing protein
MLLGLLDNGNLPVQNAALKALDQLNPSWLGQELIRRWGKLTLRLRSDALGVLLKREERCHFLLGAIEQGVVARGELSASQVSFLRNHSDQWVRETAGKIFIGAEDRSRKEVVEKLMGALEMKGDVAKGKVIFQERCASCHRMGSEGFAVGPDLVTVRDGGKEKMLVNILDPNREVATQYSAYLVETKDGESLLGVISNETATSITLRQAYGVETVIFRAKIKKIKNQGVSLMPEGVEEGLKAQGLADLMEFISQK